MFRNKLKKLTQGGEEQNEKRKIENLVFFVVILIITIVIINIIWNGKSEETKMPKNTTSKQLAKDDTKLEENLNSKETQDLSDKLETILAKIQGVGEVKVFINYCETSEVIAMYNENTKISNTEESDKSGGNRKIQETDSQKDVIFQEQNGEKTPITQKVIQPKVEGAIITAKGADNAEIKANIIQAVEAVTGLATHKIQVFEMN